MALFLTIGSSRTSTYRLLPSVLFVGAMLWALPSPASEPPIDGPPVSVPFVAFADEIPGRSPPLFEVQQAVLPVGPDVGDPGPDMGDFPNSAATLPRGRWYVESAPLTYATDDAENPASYDWPFLLRYGATDDVELRVFGNGLTSVFGSAPDTGFAPLAFDMKVHLWDGNDRFVPAASLEAYLLTDWGSGQFRGGWQPSINMNFDLPITESTNLEWTVGYTGVRDAVNIVTGRGFIPRHHHLDPAIHLVGLNVYQFTLQWAVEQEVTDRLELFIHGYYAGAVFLEQGAGNVVGTGGFYRFTDRLMGFGSVNAGLDSAVAPLACQLGFAYAL